MRFVINVTVFFLSRAIFNFLLYDDRNKRLFKGFFFIFLCRLVECFLLEYFLSSPFAMSLPDQFQFHSLSLRLLIQSFKLSISLWKRQLPIDDFLQIVNRPSLDFKVIAFNLQIHQETHKDTDKDSQVVLTSGEDHDHWVVSGREASVVACPDVQEVNA